MVLYEKLPGGIVRQHEIDPDLLNASRRNRHDIDNWRLESKLDRLIQACNRTPIVLPYGERVNLAANLENIDKNAGDSLEGEDTVKELRIRVITGFNDDGSAIIKRIGAYDELTLADKVVRTVVESGRIAEFLPDGILNHYRGSP